MTKEKLLIVLVGESGSGKSTIAEQLEQAGFPEVISHTSRSPRHREIGMLRSPYIFSTKEDYEVNKAEGYVFEETENKGTYYWTYHEDFDFEGVKVIVCDVAGVKSLKSRAKEDLKIVVIYIKSDHQDRYKRLMNSYWWNQPEPREFYHRPHAEDAVDQRMVRDIGRFNLVPCNYVVDNSGTLENTMELIHQIINQERSRG